MLLVGALPCADGRLLLYVETLTGFDLVAFSRKGAPGVMKSYSREEWGWSLEGFSQAMAVVEPGAAFLSEPMDVGAMDFDFLLRLARSLGLDASP